MIPIRDSAPLSSWKQRARRGGIYVAMATLIGTQTACSSGDSSAEQTWEEVKVQEPTKGVVTTIQEEEAGNFAIIDEKIVPKPTDSRLIIKRLSGVTDTLTLDQAKGLVGTTDTVIQQRTTQHHHYGGGLGSVIWWGAMGHMMGRSFNSPVQSFAYRPMGAQQTTGSTSASSNYRGYASGTNTANDLRTTSTTRTQMRAVSGKSGFFSRGSSRSSGG